MADPASNEPVIEPPADDIARIGVVTVSDRASRGEYEDRGGPAVRDYLSDNILSAIEFLSIVLGDERHLIEAVSRASPPPPLAATRGMGRFVELLDQMEERRATRLPQHDWTRW